MGCSTQLPAVGDKLAIQYTPGELGRSRLVGQVSWLWIGIFAASILGLAIFGVLMYREAHDTSAGKKKQ
jgi:hypothetical protein